MTGSTADPARARRPARAGMLARGVPGLFAWCFLVWLLLSWTATAEQLLTGAAISVAAAVALSPLGPVRGPWHVLRPRVLWPLLRLAGTVARGVVTANVRLAAHIWAPHPSPPSGMVVARTAATSDTQLAATGLLSSLVVDNQLVDVAAAGHELQYHAVTVPGTTPDTVRERVNGPIEDRMPPAGRKQRP